MTEIKFDVGLLGANDQFRNGFQSALKDVVSKHPLEISEKNYFKNSERREFSATRSAHGLHMPMKLQMERAVASRIQRIAGLPSSNLALRTLMGINDILGPEDIFNDVSEEDYQVVVDGRF
ncbi:proteasome maturation protein-like [Hydra vulgaris]|uniref:Proteasome maturation protein-like n=1 Tax=Hydra vulgaris TaxID=6087 RepID=A0ABM4D512_HYDVU